MDLFLSVAINWVRFLTSLATSHVFVKFLFARKGAFLKAYPNP